MQIGQAPSQTAMRTGKPFSDASGKVLKQKWYQIDEDIFYDPSLFYITCAAHCYPGKHKKGGDAPPPLHCRDKFLRRELELVKPRLYIVIGRYAADALFPKKKLEALVFQDHLYKGKPLYVLPHPSFFNARWLKAHPLFEGERIQQVRRHLHQVLKQNDARLANS